MFAEAALSCLALVGTNVGGIPEQIEDGVNGLLVSPDDEIALADALEKVISDPAYRYELSRSAWDKAKSLYSLTRVANELKNLFTVSLRNERVSSYDSISLSAYC